jgi:hypothetical protein
MTEADHPTMPAEHATHDTTIVAALAARARDLDDHATESARAQVASCTACADLLADLVLLQTTLPATSTPTRPRDFRLTAADAARLRRSGWRKVLGFFGSARDGLSRPLAIGFTTLGLAGLLVATLPSMFVAGGAAALSPVGAPVEQAAPAAGGAYGIDRMSMEAAGGASGSDDGRVFVGEDGLDPDVAGDGDILASIRDDGTGLSVLFVVAGILLIAGIGLFGLRWSARRLL